MSAALSGNPGGVHYRIKALAPCYQLYRPDMAIGVVDSIVDHLGRTCLTRSRLQPWGVILYSEAFCSSFRV